MKKTLKKSISVILAVMMLLSMTQLLSFAYTWSPADNTETPLYELTFENKTAGKSATDKIEIGDIFLATCKVKNISTLGSFAVYWQYDSSVVQVVRSTGADATAWGQTRISATEISSAIKWPTEDAYEAEGNPVDYWDWNTPLDEVTAQVYKGTGTQVTAVHSADASLKQFGSQYTFPIDMNDTGYFGHWDVPDKEEGVIVYQLYMKALSDGKPKIELSTDNTRYGAYLSLDDKKGSSYYKDLINGTVAQYVQPILGDLEDETCTHEVTTEVVTLAATCETAGSKNIVCSSCGEVVGTAEIPALGHSWEEVATAATCTADGLKKEVCSVCGEVQNEEAISALGHNWDAGVVTTAATCEADGVMTYTCQNDAAHTDTEVIAATGHDWDAGVVTKAPTYAEEGIKTYTCQNCGETYTEAIAKLAGMSLTTKISGNGTVSVNETAVNDGDIQYLPVGATKVNVTAAADEGYTFAYWMLNGKIVSYSETAAIGLAVSSELMAVFTEDVGMTYIVTFVTPSGVVIETQTVAEGGAASAPDHTPPVGLKLTGWNVAFDSVTSNLVVTAKYEQDLEVGFTVTAGTGVTITPTAREDGLYSYNTRVTAAADDMTDFVGWSIDGGTTIISYAQSYTFYVGANVTVTAVYDTNPAEAAPVTAITAATQNGAQLTVLTERSAPEGYTLVSAGIICTYRDFDLTIENANKEAKVYLYSSTSTAVNGQYSLTINLTAGYTLRYVSYAVYTDAQGNQVIVYSAESSASV